MRHEYHGLYCIMSAVCCNCLYYKICCLPRVGHDTIDNSEHDFSYRSFMMAIQFQEPFTAKSYFGLKNNESKSTLKKTPCTEKAAQGRAVMSRFEGILDFTQPEDLTGKSTSQQNISAGKLVGQTDE